MSPKKEKLKILTSKKILNVLRSSLETERHISVRDTDEEDENQNFVSRRLSQNNYGLLVNSHKILNCVCPRIAPSLNELSFFRSDEP